jgi:hypothetical protein
MDATYFLKSRIAVVRYFFAQAGASFQGLQEQIEQGLPPYDDPPYSEGPEPAFFEEWDNARTGQHIVGQASVSLLSDALKLYFQTLQTRVIGFSLSKEAQASAKRTGWVALYKDALGLILDTDWADCPADFNVIEQVVLARNSSQHGSDLTSHRVAHDAKTLTKHPRPWFASGDEIETWKECGGEAQSFLAPSLQITQERLFAAADQIEVLADWIDTRMDKAAKWRRNATS